MLRHFDMAALQGPHFNRIEHEMLVSQVAHILCNNLASADIQLQYVESHML